MTVRKVLNGTFQRMVPAVRCADVTAPAPRERPCRAPCAQSPRGASKDASGASGPAGNGTASASIGMWMLSSAT